MLRTLTIALAFATLGACSGGDAPSAEEPKPEPAPPVSANVERGPDGTAVTLLEGEALGALMAQPAGKPRVYNFWATWCGPCVAELPMLRDLAASRDDFELVLVNVDIGPMRRARALPFIAEKNLGGIRHVAVDSRDPAKVLSEVIEGWNESIPVTSVHRADGTRASLFTRALSEAELAAAIDAAR